MLQVERTRVICAKVAWLLAAACALVGVAYLDRWTGRHLGLSLFYLPPVALVAWRFGSVAGWIAVLAATVLWFVADPYEFPGMRAWNASLRLGFFGVVVYLLLRLRTELERRQHMIGELEDALEQVRTLRGLLPVCAWCTRIRDDAGYWERLDSYVSRHTPAEFTHGICPECEEMVARGDG